MDTSEVVTLVIAIWGAVVSTALGAWTIWQGLREDGRLQLSVGVGKSSSGRSVRPFFVFEVVNIGRRAVYLGGVYLRDKDGKFIDQILGSPSDGDYIKLEPGETFGNDDHEHYYDVDKFLRARKIVAVDSFGRRTRVSIWRRWQLRRDVRKIQAENEILQGKVPA